MQRKDLRNIPKKPGVYLFLSSKDEVLYVGKAINLRNRVSNYFSNPKDQKTQALVANAVDIQTIATRNELEALLLENRLIKKHKPQYNILLKNSERYAWICITEEKFPRIITARNKRRAGTYFGPYTDGTARRKTIVTLNRIFKLRTCYKLPKKVCLQYHIKNCTGPCAGHDRKENYSRRIQQAKAVLQGQSKEVIEQLKQEMTKASQNQRYEEAKNARDAISSIKTMQKSQVIERSVAHDQDVIGVHQSKSEHVIVVLHVARGVISKKEEFRLSLGENAIQDFMRAYYQERIPPKEVLTENLKQEQLETYTQFLSELASSKVNLTIPQKGPKKKLVEIAKENAQLAADEENPQLERLKIILRLSAVPTVIDCFDISTLQGTNTVAASVRYRNGSPDPSGYRRYKIQGAQQDDFAAMKEVVKRRYSKEELPDLIVVDGGKGQLSVAREALIELDLNVPIIGLAKRDEEVFVPGRRVALNISQKDPGLLLLRRIRDSTHRFAVSYQRKRRGKQLTRSALDHIKGVGPARRKQLYEKFRTFSKIKTATKKQLQEVVGEKTGEHLYDQLRENSK